MDKCELCGKEAVLLRDKAAFGAALYPYYECQACRMVFPAIRSIQEIERKIKELENADLNKMVFDEVEYGKLWLRWVLRKEGHETKLRED